MQFAICIFHFSLCNAFEPARPGYRFAFPRDHAAHPTYGSEWWYYTGHLQAADGHRFGYQLTFFRIALTSRRAGRTSKWAARDVMLAHFTVTDETTGRFTVCDRASRAALGLAGADASSKLPRIWLGDWTLRFGGKTGETQTLRASGETTDGTAFAIALTQRALKPPVAHGENGVSQKSAGVGHASHYYSFTRLETSGTLRLGQRRFAVRGHSWFDHEFGSSQLPADQTGWDWFSVQLDDGRELMLYHMRRRDGSADPFSSGTLIERNGRARHLKRSDFSIETLAHWHSPRSKADYPARWRLSLPTEGLTLEVTPTVADQELDTRRSTGVTYWEGSVRVTGTQRGRALAGDGYVELVGYAGTLGRMF